MSEQPPEQTTNGSTADADSTSMRPTPLALVVGIGGSAGALDAYERFFVGLPLGSQMAFVVISHLDPHQESLMPEILQRCTVLHVEAVRDGTVIKADSVYVAPPGFSVAVRGGTLQLQALSQAKGHTIDAFFVSLAADQGERAACVVLSGMGKDGTAGAQAIKEAGGRVLVQDPSTAEFGSMPLSAVTAGVADAVLPAEELATRLYTWVNAKSLTPLTSRDLEAEPTELHNMLLLVRSRTGHDFSGYKPSTLVRRIDRRMKSQRIQTFAEYSRMLEGSPSETEALFQDLTINVTRFFRDPDAFGQLKEHLRSMLLLRDPPQSSLRVWVPGCASGEEAYSVAIILHELVEELGRPLNIQIFATDIDQQAIDAARLSVYPLSIAHVVSAQRLQKYFRRSEEGYQIQGFIRESVVFALHNTFSDPPFTRLDLLCCRNMLIYFRAELQQRVLGVFHYALNPGGLLFLGTSETLGAQRDHFAALDSHWRIYRRGPEAARPLPSGQMTPRGAGGLSRGAAPFQGVLALPHRTLSQQAQRVLLSQYAPPAVVINASGDILFVNGQTGRYLQLPSGTGSTNNVLEMVKDGLRYDLAGGIREVQRDQREVVVHHQFFTEGGSEGSGAVGSRAVGLDITLRPLHGPEQGLVIIIFREQSGPAQLLSLETGQLDQVQSLTRELQHTRETLQANIEEMLISVEELKSTNEEYQTTIEELKSTNEELMTSKEELQSLNEELITSNSEHQAVITELGQTNDDMNNLLESAGIATLFLGNDLRIKRFTPKFASVIRLLPSDIGRPISDFHLKLNYPHVLRDIGQVLETLLPFETQVQTQDTHWHLLRITPYRTANNFIDGVVVALTDLDVVKNLEAQVRISARYAQALLEGLPDPVIVFDQHSRLVTANPALIRLLPDAEPQTLLADLNGVFGSQDVQALLDSVIAGRKPEALELALSGESQAQRFKLSAWPVSAEVAQPPLYLLLLEALPPEFSAKQQPPQT
ncbi:PAS domain-containing protein [Deinococcus detaillensis]|uniref:protein-glutamate O-methyltransferase n=1 Tax=Deinococcus detaillensis TaxID=2592048 RepID=A0A553V495_9DEIO|nr:CheR family methyltransferase [Deinococcus detaillensis]TSA87262.1 PAS domain-containing protein [Deinococcus detaillensis]